MPRHLAENVLHFARVLRAAGLPMGTDRALCAIEALRTLGVERRDDVHAALSAVMLGSHEHQVTFDAAFDAIWSPGGPASLGGAMPATLPGAEPPPAAPPRQRRVADALNPPSAAPHAHEDRADDTREDAWRAASARERLERTDFEAMSAAEYALARRLAEQIALPLQPITSRRRVRARTGRIDLRATLRAMPRQPDAPALIHQARRRVTPPLVLLIDISGSMERYSRVFLHFAHGLGRRHRGMHTFVFGTRLTNITRCLRHRDVDDALALAGQAAQDWRGGTRIASSLVEFNRRWARRVLTGNASLLLVTDGLDRDEGGELAQAAAQLRRWAREVIWLNPLLRYAGFEPKAAGIRALLPHADAMIPVHDLRSLADIARAVRVRRACGSPTGHARPADSLTHSPARKPTR